MLNPSVCFPSIVLLAENDNLKQEIDSLRNTNNTPQQSPAKKRSSTPNGNSTNTGGYAAQLNGNPNEGKVFAAGKPNKGKVDDEDSFDEMEKFDNES